MEKWIWQWAQCQHPHFRASPFPNILISIIRKTLYRSWKGRQQKGRKCALFTVRRCSVCPHLSDILEQKSEVFLREEDQGRSEVKNKKHLKKGGQNSMKTNSQELVLNSFFQASLLLNRHEKNTKLHSSANLYLCYSVMWRQKSLLKKVEYVRNLFSKKID